MSLVWKRKRETGQVKLTVYYSSGHFSMTNVSICRSDQDLTQRLRGER